MGDPHPESTSMRWSPGPLGRGSFASRGKFPAVGLKSWGLPADQEAMSASTVTIEAVVTVYVDDRRPVRPKWVVTVSADLGGTRMAQTEELLTEGNETLGDYHPMDEALGIVAARFGRLAWTIVNDRCARAKAEIAL